MRAKAGEVLADRELEAAQRGKADSDADRECAPVGADDQADDHEDDPDEDADLDERERSPRRGRARVLGGRALALGGLARDGRLRLDAALASRGRRGPLLAFLGHSELKASHTGAASPSANGQPEESLTRHQPRSIPRMPQRGRECQCLQSRSPTSSFEI